MIIHNVEQGTPEWRELRKFKMTASNAQAIGNVGKGLETYILDMLAESFSNGDEEQYTNPHMERGNELEDQARKIYQLETGRRVEQVGFVEYSQYAGCSPDGLIGEEGGLEIKCPANKKYFRVMLNGLKDVEMSYIWQVQMNMLITGREWWDLVYYNPNFKKPMLVFRITPDENMRSGILSGLEVGERRIKSIINQLPNGK